jgi:hypothetical protein
MLYNGWDRPVAHMWVRKKGIYYMYFTKTNCIFADSPTKTMDNVNGNMPIILDIVKKNQNIQIPSASDFRRHIQKTRHLPNS